MASRSHCDQCHRLADLYLERITDHVRLIEEQAGLIPQGKEDAGDVKWLIVQAERRIHEARKAFFAHIASLIIARTPSDSLGSRPPIHPIQKIYFRKPCLQTYTKLFQTY